MQASKSHYQIIIIGSGPAGLTAAIYAARANLAPLVIHGPQAGGQLTTTTEVENFPGFEHGIMGPELMQTMEAQAKRFGTQFLQKKVTSVDIKKRPFTLAADGETFTCDVLIIASGASARLLGLPAEQTMMGYGISTCATCDGAFFRDKIITVSGGGDSACEEANFLTRFGKKVYLIHRRDALRASKIMQDRVMKNPKIEILWNKAVSDVKGDKNTGVQSLTLEDTVTHQKSDLPADALFVAIGHIPNSQLFKGLIDMDENGYILTKPNSTVTNVPGVFACGDVQDHVFRQAVTAAGSGCMAAIEAERWLEAQHS
jgi:thioredoxin reductase (NADPH)